MIKAIAVLISDVHYNVHTIKLADTAMRMAIDKANDLHVPLIVSGDLHDTKANLRGECVNAMIKTFKECHVPPYIIVGNHDRINEKAPAHSLNFLEAYAMIIEKPTHQHKLGYLIPYNHDVEELKSYIQSLPKNSQLIMHQGLTSSNMGDYIQDKSALSPDDIGSHRIISGHYHQRQTIALPDGGKWDYVGNPYTMSYGEANDPPKGFQILYADGSLEFVPTNLRKHVVYDFDIGGIPNVGIGKLSCKAEDLVWVKIRGPKEDLSRITRGLVAKDICRETFKLDLIPTDTTTNIQNTQGLTQGPLLDSLIDSLSNTTDERKARLKSMWKTLCE